jgi:hypothetical protein
MAPETASAAARFSGACVMSLAGCSRRHDELSAGSFDDVVRRHRDGQNHLPNDIPIVDDTGVFTTVSAQGFVDLGNEFFQDLGANGRRCVSCHVPTVGWTLTPLARLDMGRTTRT